MYTYVELIPYLLIENQMEAILTTTASKCQLMKLGGVFDTEMLINLHIFIFDYGVISDK